MPLLTLCPAKINLGLWVVGRRADGYHDLQTTFVRLALADRLAFDPEGGRLSCEVAGRAIDCPAGDNLVLRAAAAFGEAAGIPVGGTWRLHKRIPVAAGLGGGSSDAAGALRILQRHHGNPLSHETLRRVASAIGADVPFFLVGGAATGQGRGDEVRPVAWPGEFYVVLVTQAAGLSTREVFAEYDAMRPREQLTGGPVEASVVMTDRLGCDPGGAPREVPNDLAEAAFRRMPALRRVLDAMRDQGFSAIGLSGSGPTVYGVVRDRGVARRAASRLRSRGWAVLMTAFRRGLPRVVCRVH
ncbi:4-(cytidine 5'-diphospho)-2-C-methyl-D-erythritol kinase [Candidatus Fermentibacteria bacterium]|nr:4-(cytidine 5'-diphospho)-2-C-methyl-D-erythritol kinase [Candidatus Fermentibacteria bacterium]